MTGKDPEYIIVNIIGEFRWQYETLLVVAKLSELNEELIDQLLSCGQDLQEYEISSRNDYIDKTRNLIAELIEGREQNPKDPWNEIEWRELRDFTVNHHTMMVMVSNGFI